MMNRHPAVETALATMPSIGGVALYIGAELYHVVELDPGPDHLAACRVQKGDGTCYDVVRTNYGATRCTCADYVYRKANTWELCKHGNALVRAAFLPPIGAY